MPTPTTYSELQQAFDYLNKHLFDDTLPQCLITLQREKQTQGYFSKSRFVNKDGESTDEIALNPSYFAVIPIKEVLSILGHEMVHLWQAHFGKPGRGRYHNKEWAKKMESIEIMPSTTGQPGGKKTGDRMSDYIVKGGKFDTVCDQLLTKDFKISWYDRFISRIETGFIQAEERPNEDTEPTATEPTTEQEGSILPLPFSPTALSELNFATPEMREHKQTRTKYRCNVCGNQVWGKKEMIILCGDCDANPFEAVN